MINFLDGKMLPVGQGSRREISRNTSDPWGERQSRYTACDSDALRHTDSPP